MILKEIHPMVLVPIKELFFRFKSFTGIQNRQLTVKSMVSSELHVDLLLTIKHDNGIKQTVIGLLSLDHQDRAVVVDHLINHTDMHAAPSEFKELFKSFKDPSTALRTLYYLNDSQ